MDNAIYATLTRQSGLLKEIDVVANNVANATTAGFRREGVVFSEYVADLGEENDSLSMAWAHGRTSDTSPGDMSETGGDLDFAIEGEGYFMVATPQGNQLTRAGNFHRAPDGTLVTADGYNVLDAGGAQITIPPGQIALSEDRVLSSNGAPFAEIGVFLPPQGGQVSYAAGTRFTPQGGDPEPAALARVAQGRVEGSNVNPINEIARLISVQRAYELGQSLLDREDSRIRNVITTLSQ